jgi:hypothetical protein
MINCTREPDSPTSLNTAEIQQYITDAVAYLADPDNLLKPEKPTRYRNSDLLKAFDRVFYSKCYLTEKQCINSNTMDIEHFIPQAERPDLVYEWTNLFPAEHYANMIKPRVTPEGGYLDPCNPDDDVENEILYSLSPHGFDPYFEAANPLNVKAVNTSNLLNIIHNGHNEKTRTSTLELRHTIHKKYVKILNKICEWKDAVDGSPEKFQAARELRDMLSRKSSFTMLCRSMPAVRRCIPQEFFD